mgnify:CR=1 FL=1
MFKKILVPVDGSEGSWRALDTAVELGKKFGGELHVINVSNHITMLLCWQCLWITQL